MIGSIIAIIILCSILVGIVIGVRCLKCKKDKEKILPFWAWNQQQCHKILHLNKGNNELNRLSKMRQLGLLKDLNETGEKVK